MTNCLRGAHDFAEVLTLYVRRQLKGFTHVLLQENQGVTLVPLMVADDEIRMGHLCDQMRTAPRLRKRHPIADQARVHVRNLFGGRDDRLRERPLV